MPRPPVLSLPPRGILTSRAARAARGIAAALAFLPALASAQQVRQEMLSDATGSSAEFSLMTGNVPPSGYAPVRITVKNEEKGDLTCQIQANSRTGSRSGEHSMGSTFRFTAPAGISSSHILYVPVMPVLSGNSGRQDQTVELSLASGLRSVRAVFNSQGLGGWPTVTFSTTLATKNLEELNKAAFDIVNGKGRTYYTGSFAGNFNPTELPDDWRGYSGLDALAIPADEWRRIAPGAALAIRQWIIAGGRLDLYYTGSSPEDILSQLRPDQAMLGNVAPLGSGEIRTWQWPGGELEGKTAHDWQPGKSGSPPQAEFLRHAVSDMPVRSDRTHTGAGLTTALGERSFAAWQVGVILLLFGIVVGPVNLFWLAGPGRRHRLFFTTPLISLAASLILLAVIFFQDGSGGSGRRIALVEIRPEDNTAYLQQFQISRTGVLFGSSCVLSEVSEVAPLLLPDSRWTRLKDPDAYRSADDGHRLLFSDGTTLSGDWFQSRSEQAQYIRSVRPTRGRLELKAGTGTAGTPPVLVSTLAQNLEALYYRDADGQLWKSSGPVTTGAEAVLTKAEPIDWHQWLTGSLDLFPDRQRDAVRDDDRPDRFYAVSRDAAAGLQDTLPSVEWTDDLVFLHGPVLGSN